MATTEACTGVASAFRQSGFVIQHQPVGDQIIRRYILDMREAQGQESCEVTW
jgi:hypothetical protein